MHPASFGLTVLLAGAACDDSISATIAPYLVPCHDHLRPPGYLCWLVTDDGAQPRRLPEGFGNGLDYHWGEELRVRYHHREETSDSPCGGVLGSCLHLDEVVTRTPAAAGTAFELSLPALAGGPWFEANATGLRFYAVDVACEPAICQQVVARGLTAFDVQFELTGDLAVPLRVLSTTP